MLPKIHTIIQVEPQNTASSLFYFSYY